MPHPWLRVGLLCVLGHGAGVGADRSEVSRALEERVGHGLSSHATADTTSSQIPPNVDLTDGLTEEEAVSLALWNNAALQAVLGGLGLAQADLRQAGLLVNPSFQVLAGLGSKPFEFLLIAPIEALWQRPKRVRAAEVNLQSIGEELVQSGLDLVRDTRKSHADYRMFAQQARWASEVADLAEEIAELDAKRMAAGDIAELDLQLSRLRALTARDTAAHLGQEVPIAWQRLCLLIGLPSTTVALDPADSDATPQTELAADELLTIASRSRPDLRAAELAVEAAGQRLGWQKSMTFAQVAPILSTKGIGDSGIKTGPGLGMDIPLLNRGQGRISRAEAELQQAALQLAALRAQVESETAAAAARFSQVEASLQRLQRELIPVAEQTLALSEKAYQAGDIAYLDLQNAKRPLLDLRLREAAAEAAVARVRAELGRAVGRKL